MAGAPRSRRCIHTGSAKRWQNCCRPSLTSSLWTTIPCWSTTFCLRPFTLPELGSLHRHLQAHKNADFHAHAVSDVVSGPPDASYLVQTLRPLPVKDHLTHLLVQTVNSLPNGSEWPLHENRGGYLDEKLAHLALQARKRFLPQHYFTKCCALRGTLGKLAPVGSVGAESYVILWEKSKKPKWVYFVCVCRI